MKKHHLKTFVLLGTAAAVTFTLHSAVFAQELTPGVQVTADENSPTGYTATFTYENPDAESVELTGTFGFHRDGGEVGQVPAEFVDPADWTPDVYRASFGDYAVSQELEKVEDSDYWTLSLPLPSGRYVYSYVIDGAEEKITDPANPPMESTAENAGIATLSTLDVPYDQSKQAGAIDFSFMMKTEGVPEGEVTFANYEDVNGDVRPLAVYLPAGYDEASDSAYKVLYLSHGGGGNELEWFNSGNTQYLMDNLIEQGKVEPTIVVTMNNTVYEWDYDVINKNLMEHIIPFMEETYHVSKEASGRAFAGLSMGAMTTTNVYYANPDQFGYFGIFSGSDASKDLSTMDLEQLKKPNIMIGAGNYDGAYVNNTTNLEDDRSSVGLCRKLAAQEIDFTFYEVNGGHDWTVWPQLLKIFAENHLWK